VTGTGTAGNAVGVVGTGQGSGSGVQGTGGASNGTGGTFTGGATNGTGVLATGTGTGYGLNAYAANGTGAVVATDANFPALHIRGKIASPGRAAVYLQPQDDPSGPSSAGDLYVNNSAVLKICTVAGTPGTWVSVGAQT
jgi:hypothetical protein